MLTLTSYFGFLLAALTITPALFIGLNKIRLIWIDWISQKIKIFLLDSWYSTTLFHTNYEFFSWSLRFVDNLEYYLGIDRTFFLSPRTNRNDWSFSIWNRLRPNSYYFSGIIRDCIFAIQAWRSVGSLIE